MIARVKRKVALASLAFVFTVALNRGLRAASFSHEAQALEWLSG